LRRTLFGIRHRCREQVFNDIHVSLRVLALAVAALLCATQAFAQERGTMELGVFASAASFDSTLSLKSGHGAGVRVGMFLNSRLGIEFEMAEMRVSRPNGLRSVNAGILAGRLMTVPIKTGPLSFILGGGAGVSTETNFLHSYGVDVLAGGRVALGDNAALRVDGVWDWLSDEDWKSYKSVRVGFSLFRHTAHRARSETVATPVEITKSNSVGAAETQRLRDSDVALRALRDSLRPARIRPEVPSPKAPFVTMSARIYFALDRSELTRSAKNRLDEEIVAFHANPDISIIVLEDSVQSRAGKALGNRRAQAAKDYILTNGIAPNRVVIRSSGDLREIPDSMLAQTGKTIFWVLIASDVIEKKND
jgi:outer membrane protein OmpA-like peptidoglycan-associated protein